MDNFCTSILLEVNSRKQKLLVFWRNC